MHNDNNPKPGPAQPLTLDEIPPDLELDLVDIPVDIPLAGQELQPQEAQGCEPPLRVESLQEVDASDLERLEAAYHGPTLPNAKGKPARLNERFWAALYAHENPTIYEPLENQIYVYQESRGLFVPQDLESLREELARRIYEIAEARVGKGKDYRAIPRFITMHTMTGVIEALKGLRYQKHFFDRRPLDPFSIHAANCMLVLDGDDHAFHEAKFSPAFRSRNQSPIPYDAGADDAEFRHAFFNGKMKDHDVSLIQKYCGQCLLGRNLSQTMILFDGVPKSSKTTLALVMAEVVGPDNCTQLRTAHLSERFEASAFIGKSILIAPDVKADFLSLYGASILKSLVGGDRMTAEFKRSNRRVPFDGVFNVIITSNCRLRAKVEGDEEAWRRRLLIVRFETPFSTQRVPDYHLRIVRDQGPGVLRFFIDGVKAVLSDLAASGMITTNLEQQARVNKFIDESDSLRRFLRSRLCATTDSRCDLTSNEILDAYFLYCIQNDISSLSTSEASRSLTELMKDTFGCSQSGSIKRNGKNQKGYPKVKWQ
jgi:phage/plasmid-associated DNA primase